MSLLLLVAGQGITALCQSVEPAGDYLVDLYVDGAPTGLLADFRIDAQGKALIPTQYLIDAGFTVEATEAPETEIGPGFPIDYRFDPDTQILQLYPGKVARTPGRYVPSPPPALSRQLPAIILDYGLNYQRVETPTDTQQTFFGNADFTLSRNNWLLDHQMVATRTSGETNVVRLRTTLQRDFLDRMTRLSVGDSFYRAPSWGRSSTFAGVQYGRDFSTRPEETQRPFAQLQTLIKEQSEIDIIVNGLTQSTRTVNPGLTLIAPEQIDGVNLVEVRIRDALGVERVEDLSFFSTESALARGALDYSVSIGVPREFNGIRNSYEDYLFASGTSRYGLTNWATVEAGAELSDRASTAGVGGLFTLSSIGALSVAVSASERRDEGIGTQLRAGFEHRTQNRAFQVQASLASSSYGDLATAKGVQFPDRQWFIRASQRTPIGNFRLTYNERRDKILPKRRFLNGGWDHDIRDGLSLFATGFKDFEEDGYGLSIGFRLTRGQHYARSSVDYEGEAFRGTVAGGRSRRELNDWQWSALYSDGDGPALFRGDASYQSEAGEYFIGGGKAGANTDLVIGTRGSLVGVKNAVWPTVQLGDAFALVTTPGLSGQTVFKDNRDIGSTNRHGDILVADLRPFQTNRIAISPDELSLDYTLGQADIEVIPPRRGVVEAAFDVAVDTSISFQVLGSDGTPVEPGLLVRLKNAGTRSVVGYSGRAYLEQADNDDSVQIVGDDILAEILVSELRDNPKIILPEGP